MPGAGTTYYAKWTTSVGTAVYCPIRDVTRGTTAQYLAMGIGWPIGGTQIAGMPTHNSEDRSKNYISSRFGTRSLGLHLGFDMPCAEGTPLIAVTSGHVIYISTSSDTSQGYAISVRSDTLKDPATKEYLIFTYMHMQNKPTHQIGAYVSKSTRVGLVGKTGGTDAFHLHFEASNSGGVWAPGDTREERITMRINPRFFYPADEFTGESESTRYSSISIWDEIL